MPPTTLNSEEPENPWPKTAPTEADAASVWRGLGFSDRLL